MSEPPKLLEPPSPRLLRALLEGFGAFTSPRRLLLDLSPQQATARPAGLPHSPAEVVAHLNFWLEWVLEVIAGEPPRPVPHAAEGWPEVRPEGWEALRDRFLKNLETAAAFDETVLGQPLLEQEWLGWEKHTVGSALADMAVHQAHHLGQLVTLRQLLGAWPPEGGGLTW